MADANAAAIESDAQLAADAEVQDNGVIAASVQQPRAFLDRLAIYGSFLGLVLAVAVVSFILVLILWFRGDSLHKKANTSDKAIVKLTQQMQGRGGLTYMPDFSVVMTPLALSTGGVQQLFFSAAMPAGVTPVTSAQSGTGSYEPAMWDGEIRGLSAQLPATLSTGSVQFTIFVDKVATSVVLPMDATNGAIAAIVPCAPVCFKAGQLISVVMTYATGTASPAASFTPTVHPVIQYKACAPKKVKKPCVPKCKPASSC